MLTDFLNERRGRKLLRGFRGNTLLGNCFLSWVSESFRQDIGKFYSPQVKHCNLERLIRFFFIKNVYYERPDGFP